MRVEAFHAVGGYDDDLIAGEEPDLCLRMRARGWLIRRIDAEMTLHDANILSFAGWWRRAKRAGHAYAEHVWRNRGGSDPDWVRQMRSMFFWAVLLPLCFAAGLLCAPSGLVVSAGVGGLVILQYIRMARRSVAAGESGYYARRDAALMLAAKFAHLAGSLAFWVNRLRRKRSEIIEYK